MIKVEIIDDMKDVFEKLAQSKTCDHFTKEDTLQLGDEMVELAYDTSTGIVNTVQALVKRILVASAMVGTAPEEFLVPERASEFPSKWDSSWQAARMTVVVFSSGLVMAGNALVGFPKPPPDTIQALVEDFCHRMSISLGSLLYHVRRDHLEVVFNGAMNDLYDAIMERFGEDTPE